MYTILPFIIMFVCSVIIIFKIYRKKKAKPKRVKTRGKKLSRNKQLFLILFTTNSLFVCMILPLVLLNATGKIQENTVMTTVAYILAYSNHA